MAQVRKVSHFTALGFLAVLGSALAIIGACTSSSSAGPGGNDGGGEDAGYSATNCPNGGVLGATCAQCLETSCATELAAVNGACASALACACPIGVDALACTPSTACTSAITSAAAQCTSCGAACGAPGDAGGTDAGGDATVGSQDSGGDATAVPQDGGGDSSISDAGADAISDATLLDLSWAQWPIPNSPSDIEAGAPNPESYTNNGDGTVTDNVTHLMWQQAPVGEDGGPYPTFTSSDAPAYCTGLTLAGHSDWRLPSVIELVSILDYSQPNTTPLIDPVFTGTPLTWFWTADTDLGPDTVWAVHLEYGYAQYPSAGSDYPVRCVRGGGPGPFAAKPSGAPPGRYTLQGTGAATTVYDNVTHLTWQQQGPDGGAFATGAPSDAVTYCAGVTLNGMQARVPTINELFSLYDFSNPGTTTPAIDPTYFPGTPANTPFWSSTTAVISPDQTWNVLFSGGGTQPSPDTTSYYAIRCVH